MRQGCFEVELIDNQDIPFEEITKRNKTFVIAKAGENYSVRVSVKKDVSGKYPYKFLRIGLYVDGHDVMYWKRLDLSNEIKSEGIYKEISTRFWGFKQNSTDIRSFQFQSALNESSSTDSKSQDSIGIIKVVIYRAEKIGGVFNNLSGMNDVPDKLAIDDNIKFWKQPSLATKAGPKVPSNKEKFEPVERWKNKDSSPIETIYLYYHSRDYIDFIDKFENKPTELNEREPNNKKRSLEENIQAGRDIEETAAMDDIEESDLQVLPVKKVIDCLDLTVDEQNTEWTTKEL